MMLVVVAGLIFAIARWKRHPRVSALTLTGLLLYQFQSIAFSSLYYFLPRLALHGWTWAAVDNLSIVIEVCHDIAFSIAMGLLAVAVFTGRGEQPVVSHASGVTTT